VSIMPVQPTKWCLSLHTLDATGSLGVAARSRLTTKMFFDEGRRPWFVLKVYNPT
jgi:hypothetical protein